MSDAKQNWSDGFKSKLPKHAELFSDEELEEMAQSIQKESRKQMLITAVAIVLATVTWFGLSAFLVMLIAGILGDQYEVLNPALGYWDSAVIAVVLSLLTFSLKKSS